MRVRLLSCLIVAAAAIFASAPSRAEAPAKTAARIEAECRPFLHGACSEALGAWLPRLGDELREVTDEEPISRRDAFVYEGAARIGPVGVLGDGEPHDGTSFVYGEAGPPRGRVVYDPLHRLALFDQGCCSWHETALAAGVAPPPKRVVERDLSNVRTVRGLRLDQTVAAVRAIYGPGRRRRIPGSPDVVDLSYGTFPRRPTRTSSCGQADDFFFRGGRLVLIQIVDEC